MCCWDKKPRLKLRSRRRAITAYKYLVERVHMGELDFHSASRYAEWDEWRLSAYVPIWIKGGRAGIYCYSNPDTQARFYNANRRQVRLKIWGKIHQHREEWDAPAGYRASHAEIEAVQVDGIWIPIQEYAATIKDEHELLELQQQEQLRKNEELKELIDRELNKRANDRARAIALPPSPLPKETARGDERANDVTVANSPG